MQQEVQRKLPKHFSSSSPPRYGSGVSPFGCIFVPHLCPKKLFLLELAQISKDWAACPMQMSLSEANKQWPFWSMQLSQFSACHCSSCVSSVLAEGAGTALMRGGSIAMELMSWREVKNASFLCRHWGHFYPAGSRPGLPSPVYKAGCPGWINSNEIILFIINTVLAQLSSDMLAQHWLPHSQGTKVPHQHLSLLFDVYSWTGCFTLCCSLSGIYHGALTNASRWTALCDRAPLILKYHYSPYCISYSAKSIIRRGKCSTFASGIKQ